MTEEQKLIWKMKKEMKKYLQKGQIKKYNQAWDRYMLEREKQKKIEEDKIKGERSFAE